MIILILCVLSIFVLWSWLRPRHPKSPPTYPGALPIIGHAHKLVVSAQDMWSFEKTLYNYCLQNEDLVEFRLGPQPLYIITEPNDSFTVASKCLEKPYVYKFSRDIFDRGLITATVTEWKPHRRLLNPAFNLQVLQTFVDKFVIHSKSLVAQLSNELGKEPFDVQPYLIKNTLATACQTTLGIETDENGVTVKNYAHAIDDLCILYHARFQRVWLHLQCIFNWSSYRKTEMYLMKVLKDITEAVITKRKSELKFIDSSDQTEEAASEQFKPLIDQMLELADKQDAFTDDEIRQHLDTMVAAAYDTTATTLTFILIIIGSHQDVQERLYKELQDVLGNQERDLHRHDLPKLVYMDAVIKEVLRLYPPVPRIGRYSPTDVQLKKYILPANSNVLISVYGINRHPMWGADADQFRPERWLDPASLPESRSAFASFSVGRRNCIGKLYAMMAVKTSLVYILKAYRVKSELEKLEMRCDALLKPVSGYEISLEPRT